MSTEFNAYSDEELQAKRNSVAMDVRSYAKRHRILLPETLRLMNRIDREIARRRVAIETRVGNYEIESKKAQFQREINMFDIVYDTVLTSVEEKEKVNRAHARSFAR